jgi:hypothetical protein
MASLVQAQNRKKFPVAQCPTKGELGTEKIGLDQRLQFKRRWFMM